MTNSKHVETQVIHSGRINDEQFGSLATPLYQTSTFIFKDAKQGANRFAGEEEGFIYTRLGNPTTRQLEMRKVLKMQQPHQQVWELFLLLY